MREGRRHGMLRRVIQIAFRIRYRPMRGWRDLLIAQRENRQDKLHAARRAQEMAGRGLGRGDPQAARMRAKSAMERLRFQRIVQARRRAMGVHVAVVCGLKAGFRQGLAGVVGYARAAGVEGNRRYAHRRRTPNRTAKPMDGRRGRGHARPIPTRQLPRLRRRQNRRARDRTAASPLRDSPHPSAEIRPPLTDASAAQLNRQGPHRKPPAQSNPPPARCRRRLSRKPQ